MNVADGSEMWIDAALTEIAIGGIDRVRVEVLAQRLGITKGGFYRRFRNRRALLDAMIEAWAAGRIAVIEKQTELGGETPRERIRSLIKLYTERVNTQGNAIEIAIRQWARVDVPAAAAAARVDAARLKRVSGLYESAGFSAADAAARAVLFYTFIFGQSLLFLDHSPRERVKLIDACTAALTDAEGAGVMQI